VRPERPDLCGHPSNRPRHTGVWPGVGFSCQASISFDPISQSFSEPDDKDLHRSEILPISGIETALFRLASLDWRRLSSLSRTGLSTRLSLGEASFKELVE
jgi:hypothetical protein